MADPSVEAEAGIETAFRAYLGETANEETVTAYLAGLSPLGISAERIVFAAGYRAATARAERAEALLQERHDFPDYPSPGEGEVSDADLNTEQDAWRTRWRDLDARIRAALPHPRRRRTSDE